jgi:hypothetical protein
MTGFNQAKSDNSLTKACPVCHSSNIEVEQDTNFASCDDCHNTWQPYHAESSNYEPENVPF